MEEPPPVHTPTPTDSASSGFFEVSLSPTTPVHSEPKDIGPIAPKPVVEHQPIAKKPSLKKKDSTNSVYDGVIHMGYVWYYNQNADKKSPEELAWKTREERYSRILRLDPRCNGNRWKRYFAVIWHDGRFAWYKPSTVTFYNRKFTGELEEVLFIPWRMCAFGFDVMEKLCLQQLEERILEKSNSEPSSPRLQKVSSQGTLASLLETATKGLCMCGSPSVISLIVPPSPSALESGEHSEELTCIVPRKSRESLLFAVGGHNWNQGDVYCFATEDGNDLELWKESFALLSHRKIIQKSAFDHLLNTPVVITLPGSGSW